MALCPIESAKGGGGTNSKVPCPLNEVPLLSLYFLHLKLNTKCFVFAPRVSCRTGELIYRLASPEVGLSWQDARFVIPVFLKRQLLDLYVKN